jgi:hypothetical protein
VSSVSYSSTWLMLPFLLLRSKNLAEMDACSPGYEQKKNVFLDSVRDLLLAYRGSFGIAAPFYSC